MLRASCGESVANVRSAIVDGWVVNPLLSHALILNCGEQDALHLGESDVRQTGLQFVTSRLTDFKAAQRSVLLRISILKRSPRCLKLFWRYSKPVGDKDSDFSIC